MAKYWYSYTGVNTPMARCLTANWTYVGTALPTPNPCTSINAPCLIYATGAAVTAGTGTHPSAKPGTSPAQISANLCSYLGTTIGTSNRYPPTGGGQTYVLNRP